MHLRSIHSIPVENTRIVKGITSRSELSIFIFAVCSSHSVRGISRLLALQVRLGSGECSQWVQFVREQGGDIIPHEFNRIHHDNCLYKDHRQLRGGGLWKRTFLHSYKEHFDKVCKILGGLPCLDSCGSRLLLEPRNRNWTVYTRGTSLGRQTKTFHSELCSTLLLELRVRAP